MSVKIDVVHLKKIKTLEHQKLVGEFVSQQNVKGLIVFHSVGSGKTITSLFAAKSIIEKNKNAHVIIATPASLVSNFENEIKRLGLKFANKILVESYQKLSNRFTSKGYGICNNSILIIDEAHNLNGGGKIFKHFFECSRRSLKVILLSGSPIKNSPGEISKQLSILEGTPINSIVIDSMTNIENDAKREKIFNKFFKCKFSFYKNENVENFPSVKEEIVKLKMGPKYYSEYYQIENDIKGNFPDYLENTKNVTVFLNGIRRAVNKTNVLSPKIVWIANKIVEDYNQGKKILIYSNWIDTGINILKNLLNKENIPFSNVIGGLTKKEKDTNVENYNKGKTRIILVSASGSEGLDLKGTRTVIIMEPYWNSTRIKQVVGRAARYNSHSKLPVKDRNVKVYHLILEKPDKSDRFRDDRKTESSDNILWEISQNKQNFIDVFYSTIENISIERDKQCIKS